MINIEGQKRDGRDRKRLFKKIEPRVVRCVHLHFSASGRPGGERGKAAAAAAADSDQERVREGEKNS